MDKKKYPLHQVLQVKKKRVDDAEKLLKQRKEELKKEQEILKKKEEERDKVARHLQDKYDQLNQEFDKGTTSDKVQMMKRYIKIVHENLKTEEEKVAKQKEQVDLAEKAVDVARQDLQKKRQEVDKLRIHRKEWIKIAKKEFQLAEAAEQDEVGNVLFLSNRMRRSREQS